MYLRVIIYMEIIRFCSEYRFIISKTSGTFYHAPNTQSGRFYKWIIQKRREIKVISYTYFSMFKLLYSIYKRHSISQRTKRSWVLSCYQVKFSFMLCWWNSHYTFNDAHIWILDATYITKQAIDVRYIHCTNVASWSLRSRSNYRNIWSRNSHCKAIILDSSYIPHPFAQERNR